jgi:NDP-sugar pyrophosphorylase family protein
MKLGTGGAIKHAWDYIGDESKPVLILNGDILTEVDYGDMIKELRPDSDGIILGAKVDDAASYGTLKFSNDNHLREFKEKEGLHQSGHINGGIYLFNQKVKKYFPKEASFSVEYDVFPKMKNLYVYPTDRAWIDIGVPERLEWARQNWNEKV